MREQKLEDRRNKEYAVPTEVSHVALKPTFDIVTQAKDAISLIDARDEIEGRMTRARWDMEP